MLTSDAHLQGVDGATTVASTSYLACLAGVKVFVTGGMGGVHRGAESTFDVSADLSELAQTPVVVVCAGVKSILDVEKTLEVKGLWCLIFPLVGVCVCVFFADFVAEAVDRTYHGANKKGTAYPG